MKLVRILFFFLISGSSLLKAEELKNVFISGNDAYSKGKYEEAVKLYESILGKGMESFPLYYNLGNAYFKAGNIGPAILNYERAKKINPDDEDLAANLKLANQKTEDKIEAAPSLLAEQWQNGVTNRMNEKQWSLVLILLIICSLSLFSVYIWSSKKSLKQTGFFTGSGFLILAFISFFIAKSKYNDTANSNSAIIISPSITVTGSPSEKGTRLFLLHEGTKINILEETEEWTEIKIANGNVGWVKTMNFQKI
jgi:tetratricopeptide (TPR) repeat protein